MVMIDQGLFSHGQEWSWMTKDDQYKLITLLKRTNFEKSKWKKVRCRSAAELGRSVGLGSQGKRRVWGVRWACMGRAWGVRGAFLRRMCWAISVGIARAALLSGYLGKSGHLPRWQIRFTWRYSLDTYLTKSAHLQTRYTDSDLASLEPRLFHSKLVSWKLGLYLLEWQWQI